MVHFSIRVRVLAPKSDDVLFERILMRQSLEGFDASSVVSSLYQLYWDEVRISIEYSRIC